MRRVVITGMGIVSCIGNNTQQVLASLKNGTSGISFQPDYAEMGMRSHIAGNINIDLADHIDRKVKRFMGDAAAYAYIAMQQAVEDSGLEASDISNPRTGLVLGSGGGSPSNQLLAAETFKAKGIRRVGPYKVTQTMNSTTSACLATPFKIKGINYSIASACATSAHCIGHGMEQIQFNKQDIMFAGGGEELDWTLSILFDGMGALSSKYNDSPETASRPYDSTRDGFVISCGGAVVVLEELEHALARGAKIYAEVSGYGSTSDGYDMVAPSGEGAVRCMQQAIATAGEGSIDYINAHGTSTPVGDQMELKGIREVFGNNVPYIGSTKSLAGHSLGATGAQEAIYSILMMQNNFLSASANIVQLDTDAEGMPILVEARKDIEIKRIMSNSFGFGGTNATLILDKYSD